MTSNNSTNYSVYSGAALRKKIMGAEKITNQWYGKQKKLCVKCQKDSVPVEGCSIRMQKGVFFYFCKSCVDAKNAAKKLVQE